MTEAVEPVVEQQEEAAPGAAEEEALQQQQQQPLPYVEPPAAATSVSALRPGTSGHELTLKVLSSKNVRRAGGGSSALSEAIVGDQTGVVVMTCRGPQVEIVQPGNTVRVKAGFVDMFKGSMRLAADPKVEDSVTLAEQPAKFKPNEAYNLSMVEYEIVQPKPPGETAAQ